jgi:hypothetical protein
MTYSGAIIPEGLLIYRTGFDPGFHYYQGNYWQQLTPFTHTLSQALNTNGYEISGGGGYIQVTNNNINTRGALICDGGYNSLPDLDIQETSGPQLIWHPKKYAFRAGLNNYSWTNDNIGLGSVALGYGPIASGENSVAIGNFASAIAYDAMALGRGTTASGFNSTAIASGTAIGTGSVSIRGFASGESSIAIGGNAAGNNAFSFGFGSASGQNAMSLSNNHSSKATGNYSTTIGGGYTNASGNYSTAIGYYTEASGDYSTAMGSHVSTGAQSGSFIIGDNTPVGISNNLPNQMIMRFQGGYRLYSSSNLSTGVQVAPGGNAWTTISDINRKENFAPVDGEDFLQKISSFQSVSWNYKGQDAKQYRHYGPMAQEFYTAFGKDQYGTIGDDTTINQADFDGINLIAIQALEKRTTELRKGNDELKKEINGLKQTVEQLQTDNTAQYEDIKKLKEKIAELAKTLKALSTHQ